MKRGRRSGLSSVYGFIMIYLLVMAALQTLSLSFSSAEGADAAAQRAGQVAQERSLEELRVEQSQGGNVTITNDGLIPSEVSFLLLGGPGGSREVAVQKSLAVGSTTEIALGAASPSVSAVTSLGNVFSSAGSTSPVPGGNTTTLAALVGGPDVDAQLYQNPSDPTRFFMAEGQSAYAYSSLTGEELWSFDAGEGEVTDVLPLSDGGVYVSDGYYGDQFTSTLFRLNSAGTSLAGYTMRLYRLWTTIEVQFPNNGLPPWPSGSQPVEKGLDSLYAYYDGWFFSSSGQSSVTVPGDSYELGPSDASNIYLLQVTTNPGGFGCTDPKGNIVTVYDYSAGSGGVAQEWSTPIFFNVCDLYPNELISSTAGSGVTALLFSQTYWSQPSYYGGPYTGANPYLAVLSSSGGTLLRSGTLDSSGYTSVATDGSEVYLAIPSTDQVEVLSTSGTGEGTFYDVGIPGSTLLWQDGSLFVVSSDEVEVYSSSMTLEKTISFSPDSFYSLSTSKPTELQMIAPSFLVLNSTSYAALIRNSTGYGTLLLGRY